LTTEGDMGDTSGKEKARAGEKGALKSAALLVVSVLGLLVLSTSFFRRTECTAGVSISSAPLVLHSAQARRAAARNEHSLASTDAEVIDLKLRLQQSESRVAQLEATLHPGLATGGSSASATGLQFSSLQGQMDYMRAWTLQYFNKLASQKKSPGQARFSVVPVGCSIPRPVFMLGAPPRPKKVKNTDVVVTNQYKNQLSYPYEINTINVMHFLYKRMTEPCVVLDMGANDGYYAVMAGAYGCQVVSVEPQVLCFDRLSFAIGFNGLDRLIDLRHGAVSTKPGTLSVPVAETCNGRFQTTGKVTGKTSQVPFYAADALAAGRKVYIWHVDVEGAEVDVLLSGAGILQSGLVENLIIELAPQRWPTFGVEVGKGANALAAVISAGYHCRDLADLSYVGTYADVTQNLLNNKYMEVWCWKDPALQANTPIPKLFPCSPHGQGSVTFI